MARGVRSSQSGAPPSRGASDTADGNRMGSRLQREAGQPVTLLIQVEDSDAKDQISRIGHPTNSAYLLSPSDLSFHWIRAIMNTLQAKNTSLSANSTIRFGICHRYTGSDSAGTSQSIAPTPRDEFQP